jgi:hypothetical protein
VDIHFFEGPHFPKIVTGFFLVVFLGSLFGVLYWRLKQHNISGAFAESAWITSLEVWCLGCGKPGCFFIRRALMSIWLLFLESLYLNVLLTTILANHSAKLGIETLYHMSRRN